MQVWRRVLKMVAGHGAAALVSVHAAKGSVPRAVGARMVVRPDGAFHGSIGGGQLEWQALAAARDALAAGRGPARFLDRSLGPDLGQCCGGWVRLIVETFDARDEPALRTLAAAEAAGPLALACTLDEAGRVRRAPGSAPRGAACADPQPRAWLERDGDSPTDLFLFGAGHVGRALVLALAPLPFAVRWVDPREDAFPAHVPANARPVRSADPAAELAHASPGAFVLVMTHDHPLDLAVTAAALSRPDLPFVGLIGSATKRARFERRFRELGIAPARIAALVCPIGLPGIAGKEPAVIAASVTAQLLEERERLGPAGGPAISPPQQAASLTVDG
jgi:xanthine dehydrogenase accessory factor